MTAATRPDWARLGRAVRARREALGLRQGDGGVSPATWRKVERAVDPPFLPATLRRIERALGWEPGSADRVLAGGDPIPTPANDTERIDQLIEAFDELSERFRLLAGEVQRLRQRSDRDEEFARRPGRRATAADGHRQAG